jgi:hypothetical protein
MGGLFCENERVPVPSKEMGSPGKGIILLNHVRKLLFCGLSALVLLSVSHVALAETPQAGPASAKWEFGPFLQGGTGVGVRSDFQFFAAGIEGGRSLTPVLGAGVFRGRFELAGNVMPFWQAYTPAAHTETMVVQGKTLVERVGGGTFTGASVTPVIFRWNFTPRTSKLKPWVQAAGGLIYTTHKFPPNAEVPHGTPGGTSVFNFSPQGGGGIRYFLSPSRSVDFGVNGVHISSASLGDRNPGVNASVQFTLGYTWWK